VGTTLSPEQRDQAHWQKFEAEFVVELNMTEAHDTGKRMGIVLDRDADFMAAKVWKIQKFGMVEDWNRAHPDKAMHVGDEIVRVNDVQWHANTATFISRIGGQFQSARSQAAGAKDTLRLYVQRPRIWEHKLFVGQRESAHKKDFAEEFVACISMPDQLDDTMQKTMGWQLVRQHGPMGLEDWRPAVIKYIDRLGNVEAWNKEHPERLVLEGDEIMQLDNVRFHHNSTIFLKTLQKHYRMATEVNNTNRSALVYIRRPRKVQEEFDALHPIKLIETWMRPKHSVQIAFPQASDDPSSLLGWQLLPGKETDRGSSAAVINRVGPDDSDGMPHVGRSAGSLTDTINAEQPEAIAEGDLIVEVNGLGWELFDTASDYYEVVDEALRAAARRGPDAEPVNLVLERPTRLVRKVRQNMVRGTHVHWKMRRHFKELRTTTTTEKPWLTDAKQATGATDKDEVTGASEDDDDDVIGASEDGQGDVPDGAKDENEESDDAP